MSELIVTVADVRAGGMGRGVLCARGIRDWFDRYGLDYRAFVAGGLPAATLEATGDAFALQVVAAARARAAGGGA